MRAEPLCPGSESQLRGLALCAIDICAHSVGSTRWKVAVADQNMEIVEEEGPDEDGA